MLGLTEKLTMPGKQPENRESLKSKYSQVFLELFESIGENHTSRSKAIGVTLGTFSDRSRGRSLPDHLTRVYMCCMLQALREKATDAERRGLVERGLALMKELENDGS